MWIGGVRIVILKEGQVLMLKQEHKERSFWILPGGGIEAGETAVEAAKREVKEETGLDVEIGKLIWHVEEVSTRGMRFVNYYTANILGGQATLGMDPEFSEEEQVLRELKFFTREEVKALPNLYPEALKDELWNVLLHIEEGHDVMQLRGFNGF